MAAYYALLSQTLFSQNDASPSASATGSGNSAQDALLALLGEDTSSTGTNTDGVSLEFSYQSIMQWLQPQSSGSVHI